MSISSSDAFASVAVSFVENIVAIGTCGNDGCCNSYNPSIFTLPCAVTDTQETINPALGAFLSEALNAEVFPVGAVARQLCSSHAQLAMTLKGYMHSLFVASREQFGCSLSTLIHSLWLLDRLQRRNILAQQNAAVALHKIHACTYGETCSKKTTSALLNSGLCHGGENSLITHFECWCKSCSGEDVSLSQTSSESSVSSSPEFPRRQLCRACAQNDVFSLQMWNIHIFAAAALLLSMKVNEDALAEVDAEILLDQFSHAICCEPQVLRCAERCICEGLWGNLQVTEQGLQSVIQRLGLHFD
nr:hypothetical protein Tb11.0410 [Trypanosoma brucei brucei TREU927]